MVIRIPRSDLKALLAAIGNMLIGLGVLALLVCVWTYGSMLFFQEREDEAFARELTVPRTSVSADRRIAPGEAFGRLEIPRLGLSAMVVEGVGARDLKLALGHVPGTVFPGQTGNAAIAGHRDTLFRKLRGVRARDTITVTTLRGVYRYQVESTQVVQPTNVEVLDNGDGAELTLITCYPFNYWGSAPLRYIVRAKAVESF